MPKPKLEFAPLPNRAIGDPRLSAIHFRVLGVVAIHDRLSRSRKGGQGCWASNKTLAAKTGVNYNNLSTALSELRKWQYLTVEAGQTGRRIFRVIYEEPSPTGEASTTSPGSPIGESGPRNASPSDENGLRPLRENISRSQDLVTEEYITSKREDILDNQRIDAAEAASSLRANGDGDGPPFVNLGHELRSIESNLKNGSIEDPDAIKERLWTILDETDTEEEKALFNWAKRLLEEHFLE